MIPVCITSIFLNNTLIVIVMIPIIQRWARTINIPIEQILLPLSYATLFGGLCSYIGTSSSIVTNSLYEERNPNLSKIGLFDIELYGGPVAMAGITYV